MRIGDSYKQHGHELTDEWDAIVIGSGIGGLTTAAFLAREENKRVLVLERHYTAGGFTHTFRRPGFEWDVGVHYIGEVSYERSMLRQVFDYVTDDELQWEDMGDVYDRIIIDGENYDFVKGIGRFREQMKGYFPSEAKAIDEYVDLVCATAKKSRNFFMEKALPRPVSGLIGGLLRRSALKEARVTTREVLEGLTKNQELIGVLTGQWGDYGLPPAQSSFFMHSLVAYHYFRGGAYPIGGASRMAATIAPVIAAAGGRIITNADVEEIVIRNDKAAGVRLPDGRVIEAPLVISGVGVMNTLGRLLPQEHRPKFPEINSGVLAPSVGHLSLYIGLDATDEALGLTRPNRWIYPSADHEGNVERFSNDPTAPLPVAYLSFPSAKDPDFQRRFPGKATTEVITLAPFEWFAQWDGTNWKRRGDDYESLKEQLSQRMLDAFCEQCPSTRGHVEIAELSTPLTTKHFTAHPYGAIYGLAHTPTRFEQRWLRPRTPIRGLFLTGADVGSAGVGGALMAGLMAAAAITGRNPFSVIQHYVQQRGSNETRDIAPQPAT